MCQNHLPDQLVPPCRRCGCRLRPPTVPLQCSRTCPAARGCSCLRLSPDPKHNKPESNLRRLQVISRPQTQQLQSTKTTGHLQTQNPNKSNPQSLQVIHLQTQSNPQSLQVIYLQTQSNPQSLHRSSISRPQQVQFNPQSLQVMSRPKTTTNAIQSTKPTAHPPSPDPKPQPNPQSL